MARQDKEVLPMHYFMDLPIARIARILSAPEGTVKWRLHGARLALGAKLGVVAKKPGAKVLLIALALAAITAAGAATSLAVVRLLSPAPAASEQQAYDSKSATASSLATVPLRDGGGGGAAGGSTSTAAQDRAEGTGEASATNAASIPRWRSSPRNPPSQRVLLDLHPAR